MTIQEILRQHQISDDLNCECGYNYDQHNPNEETFEVIYTAHQAEVLDKHMRGREAKAWHEGWDAGWVDAWNNAESLKTKVSISENPYE